LFSLCFQKGFLAFVPLPVFSSGKNMLLNKIGDF
jgi:hypothetical protein